jgi:hypothetical protein
LVGVVLRACDGAHDELLSDSRKQSRVFALDLGLSPNA